MYMKYIYTLVIFILMVVSSSANIINITAVQPENENFIKYTIYAFDENNEYTELDISIYYKYENKLLSTEKTKVYGKLIKQFEIFETGNYSIQIVNEETKGVFSSKIEINTIQKPQEKIINEEKEEEIIFLFDKNILLIISGIIAVVLLLFLYKYYKSPKKKY